MKQIIRLVVLLGLAITAAACAAAPTLQPAPCPTLECPTPQPPAPTQTAAPNAEEIQRQQIDAANSSDELIALFDQYMAAGEFDPAYAAAIKMTQIDPQNAEGYLRAAEAMRSASTQDYQRMNEALAAGMQNAGDPELIRQWIAENDPDLHIFQPEPVGPVNTVGNTNGNIANGGLVARQGDWVYYSNPAQFSRLYKMYSDGSQVTLITEDSVADINVIGEWVYYSCLDEGGALYRIKTDGSQRARVGGGDAANNILVVQDWIYYANKEEGLSIYKIKTDGTERTRLKDGGPYNQISMEGEWIYFADKKPDQRGYYRMRTDGSELTPIPIEGAFDQIFVQDEMIYYFAVDMNTVFQARPDGGEKIPLHEGFLVHTFNVLDGEMYLSFFLSDANSDMLSMVRTDRSDSGKFAAESSRNVFLVGDGWVYFLNENDDRLLYRIRTDGSDMQLMP